MFEKFLSVLWDRTDPYLSLFVCVLGSLGIDSLQPLSSDSATLAMQQAMLAGAEDSMDGTDDEEEEEEDEEGMEDEDEDEEDERHLSVRRDLRLDHSEGLE